MKIRFSDTGKNFLDIEIRFPVIEKNFLDIGIKFPGVGLNISDLEKGLFDKRNGFSDTSFFTIFHHFSSASLLHPINKRK